MENCEGFGVKPKRKFLFLHDWLYCYNRDCLQEHSADAVDMESTCPSCGDTLHEISLGEEHTLPPGTIVLKREYRRLDDRSMYVSIAISGKEQRNIHLPQQCLPAQGYTIEGSCVVSVQLDERTPLRVTILDLSSQAPFGRRQSTFAYWFVGRSKEMPYHIQRLLWMSVDRLITNTADRWAYVSIAIHRQSENEDVVERLTEFIVQLYPLITVSRNDE